MKLTNMKLTAAEPKAMVSPSMASGDRPLYPWGLSITLDTDALDKLGAMADDCEVGESYTLTASVDCTSCSSNVSEGGTSRSLTLQITAMSLEDDDAATEGAEKKLYGEKGTA